MVEAPNQIVFQQLGLGSVLKQYRLFVPPNQREYAWTDDEVMQLFRDFAKAIADDEPGYFLGTIVTIPRSDGALEVVEVQSRWNYLRGVLESIEERDITVDFLRYSLIAIRGHTRESQIYDAVQEKVRGENAAVVFTSTLETLAGSYVATFNGELEGLSPEATFGPHFRQCVADTY